MTRAIVAPVMLGTALAVLISPSADASPYLRHHHSLRNIYPGALHYGWRWVRVPTAIGAPTGGAPLYYYGGGYLPGYGAAYPYYSAGYAPGYGCSMDYHFQDGFCYPN